jgi:hypothetical protein
VVGVPLDPLSLVQPWQGLLKESISITLAGVDAELSNPDGLVEGVVELGEVVLEVLELVPCVVVSDNEVNLAVAALSHELLEVVDALVGLLGVGNGGRANLEALLGQRLNVLLVGCNSLVDGDTGASTTVELSAVWTCEFDLMKTYPTWSGSLMLKTYLTSYFLRAAATFWVHPSVHHCWLEWRRGTYSRPARGSPSMTASQSYIQLILFVPEKAWVKVDPA